MFLWVFVKVVSCMHWHVSWLLCPHRPDAFAVGCVPRSPKAKESAESVGSVTGIRFQLLVEMFCDTKPIGTYLDLSARHNPQPMKYCAGFTSSTSSRRSFPVVATVAVQFHIIYIYILYIYIYIIIYIYIHNFIMYKGRKIPKVIEGHEELHFDASNIMYI